MLLPLVQESTNHFGAGDAVDQSSKDSVIKLVSMPFFILNFGLRLAVLKLSQIFYIIVRRLYRKILIDINSLLLG